MANFQSLRLLVVLSGFAVAVVGTSPGGHGDCQVGNWHVNCQHSSLPSYAPDNHWRGWSIHQINSSIFVHTSTVHCISSHSLTHSVNFLHSC